jgi:Sec-independent protein translocase protein TatA
MGKAIRGFKDAVSGVEKKILDAPPEKPKMELLENPRVESKDSSLPKSG